VKLPQSFAELEPFVDHWDHPNTNARYAARLGSSMSEMTAFFDVMLSRAEEIKSYLDSKSLENLGAEDKCLGRLMFAFTIVASAVEIYRQPIVPDSGATEFEMMVEPELGRAGEKRR